MPRLIAIGDIHGCHTALVTLLAAVNPQPDDTLVTLGDYVDRGPHSKQVIDELIGLSKRCRLQPLIGNHEEMLLSTIDGGVLPTPWLQYGGVATLDSYGFSGELDCIPENHLSFFRDCADVYETDAHFFVHASYEPRLPLDEQPTRISRWRTLREVVPSAHLSGKVAILGHTPDKAGEVFSLRHLKCIDTYCYGGGWLTAYDVASGQKWQANDDGVLRD